jgi:hypothetical protein
MAWWWWYYYHCHNHDFDDLSEEEVTWPIAWESMVVFVVCSGVREFVVFVVDVPEEWIVSIVPPLVVTCAVEVVEVVELVQQQHMVVVVVVVVAWLWLLWWSLLQQRQQAPCYVL